MKNRLLTSIATGAFIGASLLAGAFTVQPAAARYVVAQVAAAVLPDPSPVPTGGVGTPATATPDPGPLATILPTLPTLPPTPDPVATPAPGTMLMGVPYQPPTDPNAAPANGQFPLENCPCTRPDGSIMYPNGLIVLPPQTANPTPRPVVPPVTLPPQATPAPAPSPTP